MRRGWIVALAIAQWALAPVLARGQTDSVRHLTLDQVLALALGQNKGLRIATLDARAQGLRVAEARADAFPQLTTDASYTHVTNTESLAFPAGTFGDVGGTLIPATRVTVAQGNSHLFLGTATVTQPITQLIRVAAGTRAAAADARAAAAARRDTELSVVYGVQRLYIGLLLATRRRETAALGVVAAELVVRDAQSGVSAGSALTAVSQGAQATLLQRHQNVLTLDNEVDDLRTELNEALGLPLETALDLAALPPPPPVAVPAGIDHPDIQIAQAGVDKARAGLTAARSAYIPDIGVFGQYVYQSDVPFLPHDNFIAGVRASWTVFNFGKREATIAERHVELDEARVNVERIRDKVSADVQKSYRRVDRARRMQQVAEAALVARKEATRLRANERQVGITTPADTAQARFDEAQAETDVLAAELDYRLAQAELARAIGREP